MKHLEQECDECGKPAGFTDTIYGGMWPNSVCDDCCGEPTPEDECEAAERAIVNAHIPGRGRL